MTFSRIARASLLLTAGLVLYAQDASPSLVLRTSVTYRTERNTLKLTDEQSREADELGREAQQETRDGNYREAMRSYYHGMAVMHGIAWTPAYEFGSSWQARVDHAIAAPGDALTIGLSPLYILGKTTGLKMVESAALVPPQKGAPQKSVASDVLLNPPFSSRVTIPPDASGDYTLEVRLRVESDTGRAEVVKTVPMHIEALAADATRLRERLAKVKDKNNRAMPSAQYFLEIYDRADRGEASPVRHHFRDGFAQANEILDAIDKGADPFAGKHGDFHKAYLSNVDHTLQPYRLLIPETYNGKPAPLVVALHGMGGDENSMFDAYDHAFKPAVEKAGFIAVCPKGRDTASMYRGSAEQDVMDVLAEVRRDYNVDPSRIYLMGHSMGGYGTWSVAMDHPDVWAALGPISGGGDAAGMAKLAHIPEYVVHGDNDPTVPVAQSRTMVEAGKKAGAHIVYVEVPGGNHMTVVAPNFEPMMEFFAKQKKAASE